MIITSKRPLFIPRKYDIPDSSKAILLDFSESASLKSTNGWNGVAKTIAGGAGGTAILNAGLEGYKISKSTHLKDVVKFANSVGVSQPLIDAHGEQALEILKSHVTRGASIFIVGTGGAIAAIEVVDNYFELGWSTRRKLTTAGGIGLVLVGLYFWLVKTGVIV